MHVNKQIRVLEVRLVNEKREHIKIVKIDRAITFAKEVKLNLVEVFPTAKPFVCRIMNFGKYKFK
ncbi:translation initiation factor IF-3 [Coxiella-like endosymbiont]|uniref:translation initiation factor IF-3 n=1 Tax=Coxiella-like endosymbiont TaxID=1592897 RepID=UPI0038D13B9D